MERIDPEALESIWAQLFHMFTLFLYAHSAGVGLFSSTHAFNNEDFQNRVLLLLLLLWGVISGTTAPPFLCMLIPIDQYLQG